MALRRGGSLAADPHLGASLGDTSDVLGLAGEALCWQIQSILCSYRGQFSSLAFGIGAQGQRSARPKHKLGGDLNATVGLFVTPHPPPWPCTSFTGGMVTLLASEPQELCPLCRKKWVKLFQTDHSFSLSLHQPPHFPLSSVG